MSTGQEVQIRVTIADKEYPMRVAQDEEEIVRKAAKIVNDSMAAYRDRYGIKDKQDLLAMVAFDSLIEKLMVEKAKQQTDHLLLARLQELNEKASAGLMP